MFNIQDAIEAAVAVGPDMNEAQAGGGGGNFTPPPEGVARLRLVSYIECGQHDDEYQGKAKVSDKVTLQFELSGKAYPATDAETGRTTPHIITIHMTKSLNEKASFYKLFKRLNHTGEYKHFAQLLGKPFIGTVVHSEKGEGDKKKVYANLRDSEGFTIKPPYVQTMDAEGEVNNVLVPVAEPVTPLRCFIWNAPAQLKEMWDSIFIDGKWDDKKDEKGNVTPGKSKNYYQNLIRSAKNWKGSAMQELLGGDALADDPAFEPERPERTEEDKQAVVEKKAGAAADPLAGV